jgi:hypothetical protein
MKKVALISLFRYKFVSAVAGLLSGGFCCFVAIQIVAAISQELPLPVFWEEVGGYFFGFNLAGLTSVTGIFIGLACAGIWARRYDLNLGLKYACLVSGVLGLFIGWAGGTYHFDVWTPWVNVSKMEPFVTSLIFCLLFFYIIFKWLLADGVEMLTDHWRIKDGDALDPEDEKIVRNCNGNGGF